MNPVSGSMESVTRVLDEDPGADVTLELAGGAHCTLSRADPRLGVWRRMLASAQGFGLPLYLERNAAGAVRVLLPVAARRVTALGPEAEGRVPVTLAASPATHFLSAARRDTVELRALLAHAAERREALLLAVEPGTLEILAARRPPESLKLLVV